MLKDISAGKVDAVVVAVDDRLHRQPAELENFIKVCDAAGLTTFASARAGEIDLNDPDAIMMMRLKGAFAAREIAKMRERVTRRKLQKAEAGEFAGGSRPFGFETDEVTHKPDEVELIREVASRVLDGETLNSIRADWNERGIQTRSGKKWSHTMIKRTVVTPRAAGLRQHQGEVMGEAVWDPILDRVTWEQVCSILNDPARRKSPASRDYPLTGVLVCALCEEPLKAMPQGGTRHYGCKAATGGCGHVFIKAQRLEGFLFGLLLPLADHPGLRDVVLEEEEGARDEARDLVLANSEDEKMLTQLGDDYADQVIKRTVFLKQSQRLRERIEQRESHLTALRGQSALDRMGGHVQENWETMSAEDKRLILLSLVQAVKVARTSRPGSNTFEPGRLDIVWRYKRLAVLAKDVEGVDLRAEGVLSGQFDDEGNELG